MNLEVYIKDGIYNLLSSKLRSSLALLGILVGTASIVAMISGGKLATNEALKQFNKLGTDYLAISIESNQRQDNETSESNNLSIIQVNTLPAINNNVQLVAPYITSFESILFKGKLINGTILGVTSHFHELLKIELEKGRLLSNLDRRQFFCVIGSEIYQTLKKSFNSNPLGDQIQIGNHIFTVVGIAKEWTGNNLIYADPNHSIMVPILTSFILNQYSSINNIIVKIKSGMAVDPIKVDLEHYLTNQLKDKKLYFRSAKELVASMKKQSEILTVFLGLIGSISLIVGGIGVMNIMLVTVIERRREIGIRLAIGATRRDIRILFLVESLLLSSLGGISGSVVGIMITYFIAWFWSWQFHVFFIPIFSGIFVSVLVGIFFGYYPAYKASKLDPVECLKSE